MKIVIELDTDDIERTKEIADAIKSILGLASFRPTGDRITMPSFVMVFTDEKPVAEEVLR